MSNAIKKQALFPVEERERRRRDVLDSKAERLEDVLVRGRRAETLYPQDRTVGAGVLVPAHRRGRLHREPHRYVVRQHLFPVRLVLGVEDLPARHVPDPRLYASSREVIIRFQRELHLRACGHEYHLWLLSGVREHVRALREAFGASVPCPVYIWHVLPREHEGGGAPLVQQGRLPCLGRLIGVGRPYHRKVGYRAQARELLYRLVRWAVLAEADGVVREDVYGLKSHEGGEPYGRLHVVREDEEGRAVGHQPRERDAVHTRTHRVLPDAEVQIPSDARRQEVAHALHDGIGRWREA